jgi:hypothetical protein
VEAPEEDYEPSAVSRGVLRWAYENGAETLGDAVDMLEQFELSNDVPEVLGEDGTVDDVRADLETGLDLTGPDTPLPTLL